MGCARSERLVRVARAANRGGARISAAQIAAILERRDAIELALEAITPDASLAWEANSVPWLPLRQLFDAFADIHGVDFAKMIKTLHPKRPALVPCLTASSRSTCRTTILEPRLLRAAGAGAGMQL